LKGKEAAISPAPSPAEIKKHALSILTGANVFRLGIVPQSPALVQLCHFEVEIEMIESKNDACRTATWHFKDALAHQ
jgi:hypothetical protein